MTYLIPTATALLGAVAAAWLVWRRYDRLFAAEQAMRYAAQAETAGTLAINDRLTFQVRAHADSVIDMWQEWWTAAEQRDAWEAEAGTWHTAYAEGIIGRPRALPAPVAADAVMAPAGGEIVELDLFRAVEADMPVSEFHSGLTGAWPKDIVETAIRDASVPV